MFAGVSREPLFFSHCIVASVHLVDTKKPNYSDLLNNHAANFIPIIGIKFAGQSTYSCLIFQLWAHYSMTLLVWLNFAELRGE